MQEHCSGACLTCVQRYHYQGAVSDNAGAYVTQSLASTPLRNSSSKPQRQACLLTGSNNQRSLSHLTVAAYRCKGKLCVFPWRCAPESLSSGLHPQEAQNQLPAASRASSTSQTGWGCQSLPGPQARPAGHHIGLPSYRRYVLIS